MMRNVVVVLIVLFLTLMVFKSFGENVGMQSSDDIAQVLSNQKIIMEQLNRIEKTVNGLKTRLY